MSLRHFLILTAMAPFLLIGCKQSDRSSAVPQGHLFGATFQTLNNPVFVEINNGLKATVEAHGDRLITIDAQFSSLKQKNDVDDLLQQQPAVIFINPVNWEGVRGTLN